MSVAYPRNLFIRVDPALKDALAAGAEKAGENVSAFARKCLRSAVGLPPDAPLVSPDRAPRVVSRDDSAGEG